MEKNINEKLKAIIHYSRLIGYKMKCGFFRSCFIGEGVEYDSSRKYSIEDDARFIDWRVSARENTQYIKTYKAKRDLNIFLCVDLSASLKSSYDNISLKNYAEKIVLIFSLLSLNENIPIGGIFFSGNEFNLYKPSSSKSAIFNMIKNIENHTQKAGSPLADAIKKTSAFLKERSLIFVISDFNVISYKNELLRLGMRHDVVAIKLINEFSYRLPDIGSIEFSDYEASFSQILNTSSKNFIKKRKLENMIELENWKKDCLHSHAYPLLINTKEDLLKVLCTFFSIYNNKKWSR